MVSAVGSWTTSEAAVRFLYAWLVRAQARGTPEADSTIESGFLGTCARIQFSELVM